jgi:hypothetical protein
MADFKSAHCDIPIDANCPPDPEGQNNERARWAEAALIKFMEVTLTDAPDAVADLLCDLMHWCDRHKVCFSHELDRAEDSYEDETRDLDQPVN